MYLRSFQNANSKVTHGFLLLSHDSMIARVWKSGDSQLRDVTIFKITENNIFEWILGLFNKVKKVFSDG
ncbi:hypothetical protein D3C85_1914570 [compost metagenome]